MLLFRVKDTDGATVWVNSAWVTIIAPDGDKTRIYMHDECGVEDITTKEPMKNLIKRIESVGGWRCVE